MMDLLNFIKQWKDELTIAISLIALAISWRSFSRSKKTHLKQIELESKTAELSEKQMNILKKEETIIPMLIISEIDGHIQFLTRTLDYINPYWINRHYDNVFGDYEFIHHNLRSETYRAYEEKVSDVDIRVNLRRYYVEIDSINSYGSDLKNSQTLDMLILDYYVKSASMLIKSAYKLCENIKSIIDPSTLKEKQVSAVFEELKNSKPYSLTVANSSMLKIKDFRNMEEAIMKKDIEFIDAEKYPHPGYIIGLYYAVFQKK